MPLEIGNNINDLAPTNPLAGDPAGQGDDHLRLIKACVVNTLPNMGAILGQVRRQDVALSISAVWNTNHFLCSASATTTVVLTLPPAASITTGFYVDITTIGTGTVSLLPSGAASINGGVSLAIPRLNSARAYFVGGLSWLADVVPHGQGGYVLGGNVSIDGTASISGATTLGSTLSVSGAAVLNSTLIVKGSMTISGTTVLAGGLSVSGATVLSGALTVSGATSISGSVFVNGALTVAGTTTLSGTVVLSNGQLAFPATQNPSSNANTLDDYEEGTWTPTFTYSTPGNVAVTYSTRVGTYTKVGNLVTLSISVSTSTFTETTASGLFQVTGLPFTPGVAGCVAICNFSGMDNLATSYHMIAGVITASSAIMTLNILNMTLGASGGLTDANHGSGVNVVLVGSGSYTV